MEKKGNGEEGERKSKMEKGRKGNHRKRKGKRKNEEGKIDYRKGETENFKKREMGRTTREK